MDYDYQVRCAEPLGSWTILAYCPTDYDAMALGRMFHSYSPHERIVIYSVILEQDIFVFGPSERINADWAREGF